MSNKQGWTEEQDIRSKKALKHQEAALKGKSIQPSNAEVVPEIDFKGSMYIGYTIESGYPEFMEIDMEISNVGRKGREGNQISMSGTAGEIMKTDDLEKRVEDYWANTNFEDEYSYLADERIGEEPSEEDVEALMPAGTPTMGEDEDAYIDAYNTAYEEAMESHKDKREEFLESIKGELMESSHPWEYHNEESVNDEWYTLTTESCGQVIDGAKNYTPVIPAKDLDFIIKSWEKHHLFGIFGNDEESGRSEPTIKTMQKLIDIYNKYQSEGGDEAHIKKIVDATGM